MSYQFDVDRSDQTALIDPTPVVQAVVRDQRGGVPAAVIGARFHRAVADLIVDLADQERDASRTVALSGGVFQNALLLRMTVKRLRAKGFHVITHRTVPPNDGGVALGQLLVGNSG
jgi:hydrogenase maturation protein HypF